MAQAVAFIGVPTSVGSYSPGQEKAPQAFRAAGFLEMLQAEGLRVVDFGDLPLRRWQPDRSQPLAQDWPTVGACARETRAIVEQALREPNLLVVIGGNCTIEIGVMAAARRAGDRVGLIYLDLHADMNTPATTREGALDWMGMAHMLNLQGCIPELAAVGDTLPLLTASAVHLFGFDPERTTPGEREALSGCGVAVTTLGAVQAGSTACARDLLRTWAKSFDHLIVHFDVDVVDFNELPLAENYSRNHGLRYTDALAVLGEFASDPRFAGIVITEVNPDHGAEDGSTVSMFCSDLARILGCTAAGASAPQV
jgi:arginase